MGEDRKTEAWIGGYVRRGKKGPMYVIERWIDGKRYHVSTKCRTHRAALREFDVFELDPANYKPERARRSEAPNARRVEMTPDLLLAYYDWMQTRPNPTTKAHANQHASCLNDWMVFYARRDVRSVKLREIREWLATRKSHAMRIQALKAFFGWLRSEKFLIERNEDPTLDLHQPPARATKDAREVAVEPNRIFAILPHLPEASRDVVVLRLGTGFHFSEVQRFAKSGVIRRTPGAFVYEMGASGPVKVPLLAVLEVAQLKAGKTTKTPIVHPEHLEAAERVRARGSVPSYFTLNRHVTDACEAAGVPRFLNWHLRHSVVSFAVESGADPEQAGPFVDHLNVNTTRRHYTQIALPKKTVPVMRVIDGGAKKSG